MGERRWHRDSTGSGSFPAAVKHDLSFMRGTSARHGRVAGGSRLCSSSRHQRATTLMSQMCRNRLWAGAARCSREGAVQVTRMTCRRAAEQMSVSIQWPWRFLSECELKIGWLLNRKIRRLGPCENQACKRLTPPLHLDVEVDGRHDAVAELLLDQLLPGGAVDRDPARRSGRSGGRMSITPDHSSSDDHRDGGQAASDISDHSP